MSGTISQPIELQVSQEISQSGNYDGSIARCRALIIEIEKITNRRTVTYFSASSESPAAFINDEDPTQIEDLLRVPSKLDGLDLILNSGGGYAISAERIINVCKTYVKKNNISEFRVIIPRLAKSAATMVALGADKILLCDNAELGPIDPQLILTENGRNFTKPAFLIQKAVDELLQKSNSVFKNKNKKYFEFLKQYNYDIYTSANNELLLSQNIAEKILKRKGSKYPDLTSKDFEIFTNPNKTFSHGRLISIEDIREETKLCSSRFIENLPTFFSKRGPNQLDADKINQLNTNLWELYIRKTMLLNDTGNPQVKVIEDGNFVMISSNPEWKANNLSMQVVPNPN